MNIDGLPISSIRKKFGTRLGDVLFAIRRYDRVTIGNGEAEFRYEAAVECSVHLLGAFGCGQEGSVDTLGGHVGESVQTALMIALLLKPELLDRMYQVLPTEPTPEVQARASHICERYGEEYGVSQCRAGCKIWRCRICRLKATQHSLIYGCNHPKAA